MEAAHHLRVNLKLVDKPCLGCRVPLKLAEDAARCTACDGGHHRRCWDAYRGCATPGCVNAPLPRLDAPVYGAAPAFATPALPADVMSCPGCRRILAAGTPMCPMCRTITYPGGVYHGPKTNAPGATAALVLGIVGLAACGLLAPFAIAKGSQATKEIRGNPTYGGGGMATAGFVLGILGCIWWGFILLGAISDGAS